MNSPVKRILGIALAVILVAGIVILVFAGRIFGGGGGAGQPTADPQVKVVKGVIGSEKKPFFNDPEVQKVFRDNGLDVQVTTAGSRQIATSVNLKQYDFAFPSSAPAAAKIERESGISTAYSPFYSPMAIATFEPIVQLLSSAGIAHQDASGTWILDMQAYLKAVSAGTRWNQLPGAASVYNSSRSMLISSTDIRSSNSAAMYLAMASYVANGDNIVSSQEQENAIIDQMSSLFLQQGFSASSSEEPFDDYLSQGVGSKPMVMIYEAQFLGQEMSATGADAITKSMVLMYPSPTVLSKHTLIPITPAGDKVGQLLSTDPKLAKLAAQYGFRPADPAVFTATLKAHKLPVPETPVNIVEPPSYETLESMIEAISTRYDSAAAGTPTPIAPAPTPTPSN